MILFWNLPLVQNQLDGSGFEKQFVGRGHEAIVWCDGFGWIWDLYIEDVYAGEVRIAPGSGDGS